MSELQEFIEKLVSNPHEQGYCTYGELLDKFDEISVSEAKEALQIYAEDKDEITHKIYEIRWLLPKNAGVAKYLLDEEETLKFLDDFDGNEDDINIDLLTVARTEKALGEFLYGKTGHELKNTFRQMRWVTHFEASNGKQFKKVKTETPKPVVKPKPKESNVGYREAGGKAGTQMKASSFFKKAGPGEQPAQSQITIKKSKPVEDEIESGLGKKRKRNEIEKAFQKTMKLDNSPSSKRVKREEKPTQNIKPKSIKPKAQTQFDSSLYCVDDGSEEQNFDTKDDSSPTNKKNLRKAFQKKKPQIPSSDEEELEPNDKENDDDNQLDMEVDDAPKVTGAMDKYTKYQQPEPSAKTRIIKKKIKRSRVDSDGFEAFYEEEVVEEVPIDETDMQVDVKQAKKMLPKKEKPSYKNPGQKQTGLMSYFTRS